MNLPNWQMYYIYWKNPQCSTRTYSHEEWVQSQQNPFIFEAFQIARETDFQSPEAVAFKTGWDKAFSFLVDHIKDAVEYLVKENKEENPGF